MKNKNTYLPLLLIALFIAWFSFQYTDADVATEFLESLNKEQLEKTLLQINDPSRQSWHFLPASMWPRPGVALGELNSEQKKLFYRLLRAYLSETGFEKTQKILELESILAELEQNPDFRDPAKYFIAFYGAPSKDSLWAWSFEGHHISLNFTIADDQISMAPRFMGANPATIPRGDHKGERTLDREEDLGLQLINSLSKKQQKTAVIQQQAFPDIVTGNASQVDPLKPSGIPMKELDKAQQNILLELIEEYLAAMPPELAKKRSDNLRKEEFDEIGFAWAGGMLLGKPHYYRIQGKTFLIEFDNIQNNANHIHTIWRDFDGDFGRDLIREHYQRSHHH